MDKEAQIKKLVTNFNITVDLKDVHFNSLEIEPHPLTNNNVCFGEKTTELYTINMRIYNLLFALKFLSFAYATSSEVLKLEINILQSYWLEKEMASCRNFLQRKRNLNVTFDVLIKLAKLSETRRLINQIAFQKQPGVTVKVSETGYSIVCKNIYKNCILLQAIWSLEWDRTECCVVDYFEFMCNDNEVEFSKRVKSKLNCLATETHGFQAKLRIWKLIMEHVRYHQEETFRKPEMVEILDSDDDDDVEILTKSEPSDKNDVLVID